MGGFILKRSDYISNKLSLVIFLLAIGLVGATIVACGKADGFGVGGKVIITGGSQ